MRLHIKIVLLIIMTLSILIYLAGFLPVFAQAGVITGRIMVPGPETNAIVTLTDNRDEIHIVSTDEKGYYFFNNLAVNANCVITANAVVNGNTMVFKDVIPHPVAAHETYDAGTADSESTTLALIVEELKEQGLADENIDLGEIQASENFKRIEKKVLDILKDNGNVMDDLGAGTAYNVTDIRADLSNLLASEGTPDLDFSSNKTTYEVTVANYISSITFTPTATDDAATIKIYGTPVPSGVPSYPVILGVGANTIDIVVTAEDKTTKTYTVTVIRAPSSNADLSNLLVSEGTLDPDFYSNTPTYEVAVPNSISSITFTPTAADYTATIKVDGTTVPSGVPSVPVRLRIRDNSIFIVVTAEDKTTKTYTVTVNRNILKDNADLCNLSLSVGTLDPKFCCTTTSYNAAVAHSVESITFTPITTDAAASVKVDGTTVEKGEPPAPVSLDVGDNIIPIVVTAEDGVSTKNYTVTVNRLTTPTLTVAVDGSGSGTVRPAAGNHTYDHGDKVNIQAKADKDSDFICWLQNANIENTTKANTRVTMNGDQTVIAIFNLNTYTITNSAGENGSISPSGDQILEHGSTPTFTISPAANYHIADVKVDRVSVGAESSYTFTNVTADHTIAATFAINTYTITASAGSGGTISPSGAVSVNYGANQSFTISPTTGYHIADVKVDGSSVGTGASYTFSNVTENHNISASFNPAAVSFAVTTENLGTETAGTAFSVTITAKDIEGNTATGYIGSHNIIWSWTASNPPDGTAPTKPADGDQTFSDGTVTVTGFTLTNSSETPTITATEIVSSASGNSTVTVNSGTLASFAFAYIDFACTKTEGMPGKNKPFAITITAKDASENTVIGYTGTGTLTLINNITGTAFPRVYIDKVVIVISSGTYEDETTVKFNDGLLDGVWTGTVIIGASSADFLYLSKGSCLALVRIKITAPDNGPTRESDPFIVTD